MIFRSDHSWKSLPNRLMSDKKSFFTVTHALFFISLIIFTAAHSSCLCNLIPGGVYTLHFPNLLRLVCIFNGWCMLGMAIYLSWPEISLSMIYIGIVLRQLGLLPAQSICHVSWIVQWEINSLLAHCAASTHSFHLAKWEGMLISPRMSICLSVHLSICPSVESIVSPHYVL